MATTFRTLTVLLALFAVAATAARGPAPFTAEDDDDLVGNASAALATVAPNNAVQAAFTRRSYAPGAVAVLRLRAAHPSVTVRVYRAAHGGEGPFQGAPVTASRVVTTPAAAVTLGDWPSGLYYARVETPGKGVWYSPFVLRPRRLGTARVAVVLPTNTWQAYNFEDGGSWYGNPSVHRVDLARPFIDGGVPPHFSGYDRGFLRWLALGKLEPDFLSDDDLDRISSLDAYRLVVFSGYEEYVTKHEFDVTQRHRDHGGNLAFLSANNFFYKVVKHGDAMDGRWRWHDLGRPEAQLVGPQYVDWNHGTFPNKPYTVAGRSSWLFKGTSYRSFGVYGIEVDAIAPSSPPGTRVLARIPNIFGPGKSAEMTYYETPRGSRVFAAGVMNFGGSALWPQVKPLLANVWRYLGTSADSRPSPTK
jgi:hypothetical protein